MDSFSQELQDFLANFAEKHQKGALPTSSIEVPTDDLHIRSALASLHKAVFMSEQDCIIQTFTAFPHNDLEPHNTSIRRTVPDETASRHELEPAITICGRRSNSFLCLRARLEGRCTRTFRLVSGLVHFIQARGATLDTFRDLVHRALQVMAGPRKTAKACRWHLYGRLDNKR